MRLGDICPKRRDMPANPNAVLDLQARILMHIEMFVRLLARDEKANHTRQN
jgi:hypothetical protein